MARGKYTVTHKASDGSVLGESKGLSQDTAFEEAEAVIEELEGDSGATLTVSWED